MKILWILMIAIMICSCRYFGPVNSLFTKNLNSKPDSSLLIGTWEIDNMSYDLITEQYKLDNRHVRIQILKTGDFHAENIPDFVTDGFGKSVNGKMIDAFGKWELDSTDNGWELMLTFNPGALYATKACTSYQLYLQNDSLVIWDYIGDPDEAKRLLYKRIK